ncbi:MAG TPA: beta-ketoacyl synthase chain length factor [Niabella sp.]|nr:beta-ketoacyl synthase chain length factor [Niabella sp.]
MEKFKFTDTLFIHQHICISPQHTSGDVDLDVLNPSANGQLTAIEPELTGVPAGLLRRMSKAVRMGIGAGLPILQQNKVDGIIVGTANGGMNDCIKFLNQIIDYDEGMLTPGNFVQSTPNAIAGQLSLITKNQQYNATHVHLGLSFENSLIDAQMHLKEKAEGNYLVGAVDEISSYNYNIDLLAGWYSQNIENQSFYQSKLPATIAGEGAAMFLLNNNAYDALARVKDIETFHASDIETVKARFKIFAEAQNLDSETTIFLTGENGDIRFNPFYHSCEALINDFPVARFKHLSGEYPTAVSFAVWLSVFALQNKRLPGHLFKTENNLSQLNNIIIYNNYHGLQHSFISITSN